MCEVLSDFFDSILSCWAAQRGADRLRRWRWNMCIKWNMTSNRYRRISKMRFESCEKVLNSLTRFTTWSAQLLRDELGELCANNVVFQIREWAINGGFLSNSQRERGSCCVILVMELDFCLYYLLKTKHSRYNLVWGMERPRSKVQQSRLEVKVNSLK